jgi:Zn-dependent protease with chaperone function
MRTDIVPYDPYHPHLGYTLAVTCLAWISIGLYSRRYLRRSPHTRTILYTLAIVLPSYAEATAYLIDLLRPAPDTQIGYLLTHIHVHVIERIPIDSFLSPITEDIVLIILAGLILGSMARFFYGSYQLNRQLASSVPIARTVHAHLLEELAATNSPRALVVPQIYVSDIEAPLALTTGMLSPRIYVTNMLLDLLTHDEMVAVLGHEWAHVLRRDNLWNWLVRLLRDIGWFLPSSHMAWRSMVASQDEACDALAVSLTHQPLALAQALVKVAGAWSGYKPQMRTISSFTHSSASPHERVEQMIWLSADMESNLITRTAVLGAYTLAAVLLLLAPLPALLGS